MAKQFVKGTEALAEGALRAGSRFFAGYPITPQTEILEYLSWRMKEVGGAFIQSESEISAISMVYGASATGQRAFTTTSGPGYALKQEGMSYIASAELPAVVVNVQRYGSGLGDIFQAQGDYWQTTKNGGHGDYRTMVLAPGNVQEMADFMELAFEKAEEYMNPVVILADGALAQMMEPIEFKEMGSHDPDKYEWSLKGKQGGPHRRMTSKSYYAGGYDKYDEYLKNKYDTIEEKEQLYENINVENAQVVMVSYGMSSRICKEAIRLAKEEGIELGLIRPITLWPFPEKAFENPSKDLKGYVTVEMSALGQMVEDVAIAANMRYPIYTISTGSIVPEAKEIVKTCKEIISGNLQEVYEKC